MNKENNMRSIPRILLFLIILLISSGISNASLEQLSSNANVTNDILITVRDGIQLFTRVYLPAQSPSGGLPTLLKRTPYGFPFDWQGHDVNGSFFNQHGYAYVVQIIRGRHSSGGVFETGNAVKESQDAIDTCEWIIAQPWSNGRIGSIGGSYSGFTSVATAINNPHIQVIISDDPWIDYREDLAGHIPSLHQLNWTYLLDHGTWAQSDIIYPMGEVLDPTTLDQELLGRNDPDWQKYLSLNDSYDPIFWNTHSLAPFFGQICAPALVLVKYPAIPISAYEIWKGLKDYGCAECQDRVRFIFTTEGHGYHLGRLPYESTYVNSLIMDYLNTFLKDANTNLNQLGKVLYKTQSENDYRFADSWPINQREITYYLANSGNDLDRGELTSTIPVSGQLSWNIDPENMSADLLEYPQVYFVSEPFTQDIYLGGRIKLDLWISASSPDVDFFAIFFDKTGPGEDDIRFVNWTWLRARYRSGTQVQQWLVPGQPVKMELQTPNFVFQIEEGHRLQIYIVNARRYYLENPLTGEPVNAQTHWNTAQVSLHMGQQYPSRVTLPVIIHTKKTTKRR